MNTHVIKIGGENASDLRTAEWLADFQNNGDQLAVAISALRTKPLNTTTELMRARDAFNKEGMSVALPILRRLFQVHLDTLKEAGMHDSALEDKIYALFTRSFSEDLAYPTDLVKGNIASAQEQRFIGYGEVMSAHVLSHLLDTRFRVANNLIDHSIRVKSSGRDISSILRDEVGQRVHDGLGSGIIIVPGYVGVSGNSILAEYGRGYTDKTAERVAVGLANLGHNPILHIQKQVPMYSSHPGNIPTAKVLDAISYRSAAEITGSRGANAQVLNGHTVSDELASHNIPIWVYNPFEKDAPRTIISAEGSNEQGIQFVDERAHVSTITISSLNMLEHGILDSVSHLLAQKGLSIDSISSSGTEITITTYKHLDAAEESELLEEINRLGNGRYTANIQNNLGLIYAVGDNLMGHPGLLEMITGTLAQAGIDIECVSQSRGQRAVTIGVSSKNLREGVRVLHARLIENRD